ncbi:hypothetical protein AOL_s00054g399 [Orbilia oligospora ATCC 24927]|uniref:Uncharacterized protein n=1 Tax=Arthrobotrys oligospora (strain ATCC 24927 / CBS 115.81 / DSM 1491) TaxID=756982 RepID=G1X6A5_ARTOA|nr:hypothetical protein AOL_s00054g399 [Orbilia oligospora ATCC 24927]EGX51329.1 hypothetical protein AOL_s00054g399 [Orbilia oligospora ATCC 24927]
MMSGPTISSSGNTGSKQLPRKTRQRARSLRKSLLTFASSSSSFTKSAVKNNGSTLNVTDIAATTAGGSNSNGNGSGGSSNGRNPGLAGVNGGGASSSLNNSEDDDHLSPPPLMMRDASVASRSSSRISRSFRRTSSSRHVDYADTVWWGWVMLITTWVVFVVGMGSVLGIWDWAWYGSATNATTGGGLWGEDYDPDDDLPIPGYYPALVILTWVVAWVWVIIAWVGMKYFRHARVAPAN